MSFCDLSNALATLTILLDGGAVQYQWSSTDSLAVEAGAPHAGADSLDDERPFQLRDGADDDHDGAAQRAAGVDVFPEANELDSDSIEFVKRFEQVPGGPSDAVAGPDQDNFEPAAAGIGHHLVERRPPGLRTADPVRELGDNLVAALSGHLA
jgi:hypothetical protein